MKKAIVINEALMRSVQQSGLAVSSEAIINLNLDLLFPHPQNDIVYSSVDDQKRIVELADNIELHGQIDALVVMKHPDADKQGMYMIISGHRRWNALKLLAQERKLVVYEKARCVVRTFGSYDESVLYLISCNSTQRQLSDYSIYMQAKIALKSIEQMRLNNDPLVRGKRSAVILSEMMNLGRNSSRTIISLEDTLDERLIGEFKDSNLTFGMIGDIRVLDVESKEMVIEKILSGKHTIQYNREVINSHYRLKAIPEDPKPTDTLEVPSVAVTPSEQEPVREVLTKTPVEEKPLVRKTVTGKVTPVKIREALIRSVNKVRTQVVEDADIDKDFLGKIDLIIDFIAETI
jgi:hypothetical protein